jgi:uncharacterized membrane protein
MSPTQNSRVELILYRVLVISGLIGLIDSVYLTYIKLTNATASCAGIGDCDAVNSSQYAEIAGIPIALLGAGAYLMMLVLLYLERRSLRWRDQVPLLLFVLTLIGVLYSAYLTYVEIAILHAICPYCVLSAVILVIMLTISVYRFVKGVPEEIGER